MEGYAKLFTDRPGVLGFRFAAGAQQHGPAADFEARLLQQGAAHRGIHAAGHGGQQLFHGAASFRFSLL